MRERRFRPSGFNRAADALRQDRGRTLHEQVADLLGRRLRTDFAVGDRIPTEGEIGTEYGVSRVTVRRALQTLEGRGLLVRRQGVGTFVAQKQNAFVYEIGQFGPFLDVFSGNEDGIDVALTAFGWREGEEMPQLGRHDEGILVYERVYSTGGCAHALLRLGLPKELGELVSRSDAESMGIYKLLEERLETPPVRAAYRISSELPHAPLSAMLGVSRTTPLLKVERTSYDKDERAIECTVHYLLPQVYNLAVDVSRASP